MPEEPVPIRRALVGCLVIMLLGFGVALLVRPLVYTLAPPRDDSVVVVAQASEVVDAPIRREVLLSGSYGWDGAIDAGDGRSQLPVIVSPAATGAAVVAMAAASPLQEDCEVEIADDRLRDCAGREWTLAGLPIDAGVPPLQRFPVQIEGGAVLVDFTQTVEG